MNNLYNKVGIVLSIIILLAACGLTNKQSRPEPVAEIYPGILQGYLAHNEVPNSIALLPKPNSKDSSIFAGELALNKQMLALHGSKRWDLAVQDADLKFPQAASTFSCAIDAKISEQNTPHLYMLMRRAATDAGTSVYPAKMHYKRERPFVQNKQPTCRPEKEKKLSSSYPSGHTAIGWIWALIFSEISPEHSDAVLARGWSFGESRAICNVHWQSDVAMGRVMGSATFARLHANPEFKADMSQAKIELEQVRLKGFKSARDCKVEANAIAVAN